MFFSIAKRVLLTFEGYPVVLRIPYADRADRKYRPDIERRCNRVKNELEFGAGEDRKGALSYRACRASSSKSMAINFSPSWAMRLHGVSGS